MPKKNLAADMQLNDSDVQAIICALPLVVLASSESDIQSDINESLCTSAAEKLLRGEHSFLLNEIRVIYCAVSAAKMVLFGGNEEFLISLPAGKRDELARYLFAYNKLAPVFERLLDDICNKHQLYDLP